MTALLEKYLGGADGRREETELWRDLGVAAKSSAAPVAFFCVARQLYLA
jgi:hypothetical protein